MDDLLAEFITETRETLEALGQEIVAWEANPADRTRLDSIFRFVHTVKGSCGFLDLPRLQKLSHAAEDVLADVRNGRRQPDARLVNAVLAVIDRIGELSEAIQSGAAVPHHEDQQLIDALAPAGAEPAPAAAVPPPPATAPEAPVATAPTAPAAAMLARAVPRSIRLPVDLLDRMMAGVSDLVLARNELARQMREGQTASGAEAAFDRLSASVAEIRDAITRTRMARIDNLFSALPRLVRDTSADLGKLVALDVQGGDVELDREMIEAIRDPLTHIVRNAIDHGVETPDQRQQRGKPITARLRIAARQSGNQILIDAIDDGRGIDVERLVERAIASGVVTAERAAGLSHKARLDLMFAPGLSTATAVTAISGRGVGMDVVRANVERIGGMVEIESRIGEGTRITLRAPLTLTIIPALTIAVAGQNYAIPRSAIEEIVRLGTQTATMAPVGGTLLATIRGRRIPVVALDRFLGLGGCDAETTARVLVVVRAGGGEHYALAVDAVLDHEELVVKPAAPAIVAAGVFAGTTLPDNSRPMLLLDVAAIAHQAGVRPAGDEAAPRPAPAAAETSEQTLLFRDLDGMERAVRLALVQRIDEVPASAIGRIAGRMRMTYDGLVLPLVAAVDDLPERRLQVLRLSDGSAEIAYPIDQVIDVVAAAPRIIPASRPGPVAGVLPFAGRAIEMLDAFWLFAEAAADQAAGAPATATPLCLLADADDPWTRQVLAPLVTAAGYRVAFAGECGAAEADVVIAGGALADAAADVPADAPVIRLRPEPARRQDDGSVYRYDRAALLAAIGKSVGRGA
ncbi:MAG: chemotaxis protein CheW [Sphingomonas fennica]